MNHGKTVGQPCLDLRVGDNRPLASPFNLRGMNMRFGYGIELMPDIPEIFFIVAGGACEVGA